MGITARANQKAIGKKANDDVGETVQAVIDGLMPVEIALQTLPDFGGTEACYVTNMQPLFLLRHRLPMCLGFFLRTLQLQPLGNEVLAVS